MVSCAAVKTRVDQPRRASPVSSRDNLPVKPLPLIKFSMDEVSLHPKCGSVPLLDLKILAVGFVRSTMRRVFFKVNASLRPSSRFGFEVQKLLPSPPLLRSLYIWSARSSFPIAFSCAWSLPKHFISQVAFQNNPNDLCTEFYSYFRLRYSPQ